MISQSLTRRSLDLKGANLHPGEGNSIGLQLRQGPRTALLHQRILPRQPQQHRLGAVLAKSAAGTFLIGGRSDGSWPSLPTSTHGYEASLEARRGAVNGGATLQVAGRRGPHLERPAGRTPALLWTTPSMSLGDWTRIQSPCVLPRSWAHLRLPGTTFQVPLNTTQHSDRDRILQVSQPPCIAQPRQLWPAGYGSWGVGEAPAPIWTPRPSA